MEPELIEDDNRQKRLALKLDSVLHRMHPAEESERIQDLLGKP